MVASTLAILAALSLAAAAPSPADPVRVTLTHDFPPPPSATVDSYRERFVSGKLETALELNVCIAPVDGFLVPVTCDSSPRGNFSDRTGFFRWGEGGTLGSVAIVDNIIGKRVPVTPGAPSRLVRYGGMTHDVSPNPIFPHSIRTVPTENETELCFEVRADTVVLNYCNPEGDVSKAQQFRLK